MTYAVLTGRIIFTSTSGEDSEISVASLKHILSEIGTFEIGTEEILAASGIFGGDSFQVVFSDTRRAVMSALYVRARLLSMSREKKKVAIKLSIGFGEIECMDNDCVENSSGEAFLLSRRGFDCMTNKQQLSLTSKAKEMITLKAISSSLDYIVNQWTNRQAEVVSIWLTKKTQISIAAELKLTQPTVNKHLYLAGAYAIKDTLNAIDCLINNSES